MVIWNLLLFLILIIYYLLLLVIIRYFVTWLPVVCYQLLSRIMYLYMYIYSLEPFLDAKSMFNFASNLVPGVII